MQVNNHTLVIRPGAARRVASQALEQYRRFEDGSEAGEGSRITFLYEVPDETPYELASTIMAWTMWCRKQQEREDDPWTKKLHPRIVHRGNYFSAQRGVEVCADAARMVEELEDFVEQGDVLEAIYEEPFLDRVLQPLQLLANLDSQADTINDERQVAATHERIRGELLIYGPDFTPIPE